MSVLYFAYGDNLNAKNLYYTCKKKKVAYPFTRPLCKAYIPDYKLSVLKQNQDKHFGLLTIEESKGHIVPGVLFEVAPESDLSIFSDEFEEVGVYEVFTDRWYEALVNKFETNNLLDLRKARLSKGRKKIYRQAVKWRNLEDFDACYESAMCNYLYPYLVKDIFVPEKAKDLMDFMNPDDYNSVRGFADLNGEVIPGRLFYSTSLKIRHDLQKIDNFDNGYIRFAANVLTEGEVPSLAWCYV